MYRKVINVSAKKNATAVIAHNVACFACSWVTDPDLPPTMSVRVEFVKGNANYHTTMQSGWMRIGYDA